MKRKLTIAAGIIHEPKILFLDEPTTGIDVTSARQIRKLILDLNKKGTTIFLTTHYIEEAERLCHRVAFIVDGKIVRAGTIAELMKEVQQETIVQFMLDGDIYRFKQVAIERFPNFMIEIVGESVLRIHSPSLISLAPFIKIFEENNLLVFEAKMIRPSLVSHGLLVRIIHTGAGAAPFYKAAILYPSAYLRDRYLKNSYDWQRGDSALVELFGSFRVQPLFISLQYKKR